MLYDDDGVSFVNKFVQYIHQYTDIFKMKSGGRFVEDIECLARITLGEFRSQLYALALTSGERGGGLSQLDIAQSHFLDNLNLIQYLGHILEELHRTVDGHIQHIGNGLAFKAHFQRLAVIAFAVAHLARHIHIRQEIHLNAFVAVALASLAASATDVEGEASRLISTYLRFGQADKQIADIGKHTGISGRIGTRRSSQRRLVHIHHLVYIFQPFNTVIVQRILQ